MQTEIQTFERPSNLWVLLSFLSRLKPRAFALHFSKSPDSQYTIRLNHTVLVVSYERQR